MWYSMAFIHCARSASDDADINKTRFGVVNLIEKGLFSSFVIGSTTQDLLSKRTPKGSHLFFAVNSFSQYLSF